MTLMAGRICMVTGATRGIGEITARELARMGATVVLVGRSEERARQTQADIIATTGNENLSYLIGDLSSIDDVRRVAEEFLAKYDALHVLINNAGAIFVNQQTTVDGYEKTFALNHLSYFLLTKLLLDTIKASGTPDRKARIISVSSGAHRMGKLDFDNLQSETGYRSMGAYGQSKLMNILFAYELAHRLEAEGAHVTSNALHPGMVATGFGRNNGGLARFVMNLLKPFSLTPEQGADTPIYLATSPEVEDVSGKYFENKEQKPSSSASMRREDQARLWAISEELTGIKEAALN